MRLHVSFEEQAASFPAAMEENEQQIGVTFQEIYIQSVIPYGWHDTRPVTATADDVTDRKVIVDAAGLLITGTIPDGDEVSY